MSSDLKIDINCIKENIREYRLRLGKNKKFCAVVKADCYGLGANRICREIESMVDFFAVSSEKEFLSLKRVVDKPIIILTPIYKNITKSARMECEFCISNIFQFERILRVSKRNKNIKYKVHLAINTGMNRFGFCNYDEVVSVIKEVQKTQNIIINGVFSHFYMGNNENISKMQLLKFKNIKHRLSQVYDVSKIIFHIANTDGFDFGNSLDMVRIGLGMFFKHNKNTISLTSEVVEIRNINSGETVGYNLGYISEKKRKIAVISIGYADGIFRSISKRGFVLINGKFSKILAVCMDATIVDITNIEVSRCDKVVVIGKSGDKQIFVCDIARWCDTIEYEILTRISKRVKRLYIGGNDNANYNRKV